MDSVQIVSLLGAALILAAFGANQTGALSPSHTLYNLANFAGAAVLAWVAVMNAQYGFIVLEGSWAAISLIAVVRGSRAKSQLERPVIGDRGRPG
jgi:hypothetical protein